MVFEGMLPKDSQIPNLLLLLLFLCELCVCVCSIGVMRKASKFVSLSLNGHNVLSLNSRRNSRMKPSSQ